MDHTRYIYPSILLYSFTQALLYFCFYPSILQYSFTQAFLSYYIPSFNILSYHIPSYLSFYLYIPSHRSYYIPSSFYLTIFLHIGLSILLYPFISILSILPYSFTQVLLYFCFYHYFLLYPFISFFLLLNQFKSLSFFFILFIFLSCSTSKKNTSSISDLGFLSPLIIRPNLSIYLSFPFLDRRRQIGRSHKPILF